MHQSNILFIHNSSDNCSILHKHPIHHNVCAWSILQRHRNFPNKLCSLCQSYGMHSHITKWRILCQTRRYTYNLLQQVLISVQSDNQSNNWWMHSHNIQRIVTITSRSKIPLRLCWSSSCNICITFIQLYRWFVYRYRKKKASKWCNHNLDELSTSFRHRWLLKKLRTRSKLLLVYKQVRLAYWNSYALSIMKNLIYI